MNSSIGGRVFPCEALIVLNACLLRAYLRTAARTSVASYSAHADVGLYTRAWEEAELVARTGGEEAGHSTATAGKERRNKDTVSKFLQILEGTAKPHQFLP